MNFKIASVGTAFVLMIGCASVDSTRGTDATASEMGEQASPSSGYTATVTTNPSPAKVNEEAQIDVRVSRTEGGRPGPVTDFELLHTKPLHLIAISSDLEDFIHIHPDLDPAKGNLTTKATFGRAQPYTAFLEYEPRGETQEQLSIVPIHTDGEQSVQANLPGSEAFDGAGSKTIVASDTKVELIGKPFGTIMADHSAHLTIKFSDTSGQPIHDLTNWLGMPAHGIIVSPDLKTFRHIHGMPESGGHTHSGHGHDDMASTSTGPIGIDVSLPKEGLYKLFLQFQRGDRLITAPFILSVSANHGSVDPEPSCEHVTCPAGQSCMIMGSPPEAMCM